MKADTREMVRRLKNMYFSIEIFRVLISKCTKKWVANNKKLRCTKMDNSCPVYLVFFLSRVVYI